MKTWVTLSILFAGMALIGEAHGQGSLIFNSFGPGDTYDSGAGSAVQGPNSGYGLFTSGFSFVPSSTLTLDTVQIAIGTLSGTNAFSLFVQAADGPSGMPGTVLETFEVNGQMQPFGVVNPLITLTSTARPELEAGVNYWLVSAGEGDARAAWNLNDLGLQGMFYSYQGGRDVLLNNQWIGAYRISGVPEPGSGWLLILGLVVFRVQRLRHHRRNITELSRAVAPRVSH